MYSSADETAFRAVQAVGRFLWHHVGTFILLGSAVVGFLLLHHYRLRLATEAGRLRGAYEAARAREMQRAREFGQNAKPQNQPPPPPPQD